MTPDKPSIKIPEMLLYPPEDNVTGLFKYKGNSADAIPPEVVSPLKPPEPETSSIEMFFKLNDWSISSVEPLSWYVQNDIAAINYFLFRDAAIIPQVIKPNTTTPPPISPILAPVDIEPQNLTSSFGASVP